MENSLWIFGDSFSTIWEKMIRRDLGKRYTEYKGYVPKIFSHYLSDMLGMGVNQLGIGGLDNYTIFDNVINNIDSMVSGDIVIIGWSHPSRFRLEKNDKWLTIHDPAPRLANLPTHLVEFYKFIDINTIQQIRVNRMHSLYWDEVVNWSKLLTTLFELKGINVIFWSPFVLCKDRMLKKALVPDDWYIGIDLNRLDKDTNGVINDSHFSEESHYKLAQILYQKIIDK